MHRISCSNLICEHAKQQAAIQVVLQVQHMYGIDISCVRTHLNHASLSVVYGRDLLAPVLRASIMAKAANDPTITKHRRMALHVIACNRMCSCSRDGCMPPHACLIIVRVERMYLA